MNSLFVNRSKLLKNRQRSDCKLRPSPRPPKKRSILEIFAIAPQIDSLMDLESGDDMTMKLKLKGFPRWVSI